MAQRSRSEREEERLADAVLVMLVERMAGVEWGESEAGEAEGGADGSDMLHDNDQQQGQGHDHHKHAPLYQRTKQHLEADVEAHSAALRHQGATRRVRAQVLGEKRKLALRVQLIEREARETTVRHERRVARLLLRQARLRRSPDTESLPGLSDTDDDVGPVQRTLNSWRQMFNRIYTDPNAEADGAKAKKEDARSSGDKYAQVSEEEEDMRKLRFRLHRRLHSVVDPLLMTSEEQRIHAFIQQTINSTRLNNTQEQSNSELHSRLAGAESSSYGRGRVYITDAGAQLSTRMGVNATDIALYLQRLQASGRRTADSSPDTATTRCMLRLLDLRPLVLPPIHSSSHSPRHHVTGVTSLRDSERASSLAESLLSVRFCRYTRVPPQKDIYMS